MKSSVLFEDKPNNAAEKVVAEDVDAIRIGEGLTLLDSSMLVRVALTNSSEESSNDILP
jgi:hypothetical protein